LRSRRRAPARSWVARSANEFVMFRRRAERLPVGVSAALVAINDHCPCEGKT
jgi:hypothetical protein